VRPRKLASLLAAGRTEAECDRLEKSLKGGKIKDCLHQPYEFLRGSQGGRGIGATGCSTSISTEGGNRIGFILKLSGTKEALHQIRKKKPKGGDPVRFQKRRDKETENI